MYFLSHVPVVIISMSLSSKVAQLICLNVKTIFRLLLFLGNKRAQFVKWASVITFLITTPYDLSMPLVAAGIDFLKWQRFHQPAKQRAPSYLHKCLLFSLVVLCRYGKYLVTD